VEDVAAAVGSARAGDPRAWKALVDGHSGLVWSVVRGFRFDDETAKDVFQTVWLRLAENLDNIREPAKLAGWLGRTARNECVGVVRQRGRTVPSDDPAQLGPPLGRLPDPWAEPGADLERAEAREAVAATFERLGQRCRELLGLLVSDPPASYEAIAEVLDMPIGSIGPTRARCLQNLRSSPEIVGITGGLRSS
jgi:RNA polymerase sigma factor (sigma-70 family)